MVLRILFAFYLSVFAFFATSKAFAYNELKHITLAVYVNPVGAPQAFFSSDLLTPHGIDIDIMHELQRRLGFQLKENRIYPLDRASAFNRLKDGSADIVIGGLSYTEERAEMFDFSPIFYNSNLTIAFSPTHNSQIRSSKDVKGLRIGFESGSSSVDYVNHLGAKGVPFENLTLAFYQVSLGQLDGIIYDKPPVENFTNRVNNMKLSFTKDIFGAEACQFAFVLAKDSPYTEIISTTMEKMMMDGTIDAILKKWNASTINDF